MAINGDNEALKSALASVAAGTVIEVEGIFSGEQWNNITSAPDVVVKSVNPIDPIQGAANPNPPAIFGNLHLNNCHNFGFEDCRFRYPPSPGYDTGTWVGMPNNVATIYMFSGCSDLKFSMCELEGNRDTNGRGYAVHALNSNNLEFCDGYIHWYARSMILGQCDQVEFRRNTIRNISIDGVNLYIATNVNITDNYMEVFNPQAGAHPDGIQIASGGAGAPSTDVLINRNFFNWANCSIPPQTIFLGNPEPAPFYQRITTTNNLIYGAHIHGISIERITDFTCNNNTLISALHQVPFVGPPGINLDGESTIASILNNVGPAGSVQYQLSTTPSDPNSPENNFVNPNNEEATTLADLQAKPGSPVDLGLLGSPLTHEGVTPPGPIAHNIKVR